MENLDPEIKAMAAIAATLDGLDVDVRGRVLRWAADKFSVVISASKQEGSTQYDSGEGEDKPAQFSDFADLLEAVSPTSNLEKMLTGAYWLQVIQGTVYWQSRQVNDILKDTGNGIHHIIDALDSAQNKTPALVRQTAKSGKSAQARKTYKLTTSGVSFIALKIGEATSFADTMGS